MKPLELMPPRNKTQRRNRMQQNRRNLCRLAQTGPVADVSPTGGPSQGAQTSCGTPEAEGATSVMP